MNIEDLPNTAFPPAHALDSSVRPGQSRRRVLRNAFLITSGVALGVLDLVPLSRPRRASAAYTVWTNGCHTYHTNDQTCEPSNAYYGSDNCDTDGSGWHRAQSNTALSSCVTATYTHNSSSCDTRNAWYWATGGSSYTKCSDGYKVSYDYCNSVSVIDKFSICRTYH